MILLKCFKNNRCLETNIVRLKVFHPICAVHIQKLFLKKSFPLFFLPLATFESSLCYSFSLIHSTSPTWYSSKHFTLFTNQERRSLPPFLSSTDLDFGKQGPRRGVDVRKENRNDTFLQLAIGVKIWTLCEQLSIFFLFYWPHLGLY